MRHFAAFLLVLILCACSARMPPPGKDFKEHNDAAMMPPDAPYGVWNMARSGAGKGEDFKEQVEALESIGYLAGSTGAPAATGVRLRKDSAQPGVNFFTSGHAPAAWLVDMDGAPLHEWHYELKAVWPDYPLRKDSPKTGYWRRAHPLPDGACLAIFEGIGIIKVDKDSRLLWARQNGAHHDLQVLENGDIWVLTRKAHEVADINSRYPTLEDFATLLDAEGNEKKSISLLQAARQSGETGLGIWNAMMPDGDVMHSNSIRMLSGEATAKVPAFKPGMLLISMLYPNTIALLDPVSGTFPWAMRGNWRRQHHATQRANGNLMLFDNRSTANRSAVCEVDPATGALVWEYRGDDAHPFYSYSCGAYQELENGNVLITESDGGRAFEITRDGETVWEFINPHVAGEKGEYIATLFELKRLPPEYTKALGK